MVIVGVSIDLTTHADVPTRVRNAVVAHTRPSGAIAGGGCPGGHFVISSSNARAGAVTGEHAVPPRYGLGPTQSPPAVLLEPLSL